MRESATGTGVMPFASACSHGAATIGWRSCRRIFEPNPAGTKWPVKPFLRQSMGMVPAGLCFDLWRDAMKAGLCEDASVRSKVWV
jgi:hypothetical protein